MKDKPKPQAPKIIPKSPNPVPKPYNPNTPIRRDNPSQPGIEKR